MWSLTMTIEGACQEHGAPCSLCLRLWCALMRVVADAGYAPGVCVCVCLELPFWSKLCVYVSPLADFRTCLALRAAVAGFSHSNVFLRFFFEKKQQKRRRANFPRHEHPKKGLAMSSGQCHLFCDSQFVSQRLRLVFESACDSLSQQASHFLE